MKVQKEANGDQKFEKKNPKMYNIRKVKTIVGAYCFPSLFQYIKPAEKLSNKIGQLLGKVVYIVYLISDCI